MHHLALNTRWLFLKQMQTKAALYCSLYKNCAVWHELFGSRARGDARPDSDYDVAVFLKDAGTFTDESARLAAVSTDILFDTGAVISAMPFPAGAYRERTGFMSELRQDGLDL